MKTLKSKVTSYSFFFKLAISSILILFSVNSSEAQSLKINEIMSSNGTTIADADGDYSDWIELHNTSDQPINLEGFGLSDDEEVPMKWVFPAIEIKEKGFLLVWASGKDKFDNGQLHANFSISAAGEPILLSNSDGEKVDQVPAKEIPRDYSFGRQVDGGQSLTFFFPSSPGFPNEQGTKITLLDSPTVSLQSGWYSNPVNIEISNPNENSVILYTLDGSEPALENIDAAVPYAVNYFYKEEGTPNYNVDRKNKTYQYEDPIVLNEKSNEPNDISEIITTYFDQFGIRWIKPAKKLPKANILKIRVFQNGDYSPTITKTYFVEGQNKINHSLPVISIVADNFDFFSFDEGIFVEGRRYFDAGGTETSYINKGNYQQGGELFERPITLEFFENKESKFTQNLGVRIHGGAARRVPNKGLRLYARRDYDNSNTIEYPVFPGNKNKLGKEITDYRRLLLRNGGDLTDYLTDDVIHQAIKDMNIGTQNSRPAVNYFNGEYWGLVNIRDRIDNNYLRNYYEVDPDQVIMINAPWGQSSSVNIESGELRDIDDYRSLYNLVTNGDIEEEATYELVKSKLDVLSYVDFVVSFVYFNNVDWYGHKHYRYWKSKRLSDNPYEDGRYRLIVWDFDASLRFGAGFNTLENWIHPEGKGNQYATNDPEKTLFLRSLLRNNEFKNLFINRFYDLINSSFDPDRIIEIADSHFKLIETEFENHKDRWGYYPSSLDIASNYKNSLNQLKGYMVSRPEMQREMLRSELGLGDDIEVIVDISNPGMGEVQINTLTINHSLHGISGQTYPWNGIYNRSVPIQLSPKAKEGFLFDHWLIDGNKINEEDISLNLEKNTNITAIFVENPIVERRAIYYWFFGTELDNNLALTQIPSNYTRTQIPGNLSFEPAISPYPGEGSAGIMDRVNDPTEINFKPTLLEELGYTFEDMRGLRVRNPLQVEDQLGYLIIDAPMVSHEKPKFSAAVSKTNNGPEGISISYRTSIDGDWTTSDLSDNSFILDTEFGMLELDFDMVEDAKNNPEFQIRIDFEGNTASNSGNVRFNNIAIEAFPLRGDDLITDLPDFPKEESLPTFNKIYPNPFSEKLYIEINEKAMSQISYIQILDIRGIEVGRLENITQTTEVLDMGHLSSGLYIINVLTRTKLESFKIIKN
ncbi:CotH kinase family protein [Belliella marina]|uniref:CotH kinase family protein n=1 Tax=Belliella marina TaxID=1644146 RepID=A0ABW4VJZ8_9BACT